MFRNTPLEAGGRYEIARNSGTKLSVNSFGASYLITFLWLGLMITITCISTRDLRAQVSPDAESDWVELDRGDQAEGFAFTKARTLRYRNKQITGIKFAPSAKRIAISPASRSGKYAICVTFDDFESKAYLLFLGRFIGKQLTLNGPPSVWVSWSPKGDFAVLASYFEADSAIYSIELSLGRTRKFTFDLARNTEEETFDLNDISWDDDKTFRLRATVTCNPYTSDDCEDRDKPLRRYELTADIATLAVDLAKIP